MQPRRKKTLSKYLEDLRNKGIIEYKDKEYYIADKLLITWLKHEKWYMVTIQHNILKSE